MVHLRDWHLVPRDLFDQDGASGHPREQREDGKVRAVLLPHIDFARGGISYTHALKELVESTPAKLFVIIGIVYVVIRHFGPEAQAGFGIGARIAQSMFLPAMAVAFAAAPIVGQNFGARRPDRVRQTFRSSALIGAGIMLTLTLLCQIRPEVLPLPFAQDPRTLAVASEYLRILSWNFLATGFVPGSFLVRVDFLVDTFARRAVLSSRHGESFLSANPQRVGTSARRSRP